MVDFCLAPGGTVLIGFELRNAVDVERMGKALAQAGFDCEALTAKDCLSAEAYTMPAMEREAIVLRCSRVGEDAVLVPSGSRRRSA